MRIYKDLNNLPAFKNAVLTIGSFDGVHVGHQQIIQQINDLARSIDGESILITFDPHPRFVVGKRQDNLKLLNTLEEKANLLEQCAVDVLVVVPFSKEFASQSPDAYIQDFLVKHFNPQIIAIGYDHKFGQNRVGDISYLKKFESKYNFRVVEISKQEVADIAVSSTKVRKALLEGNVHQAECLLGHPYGLRGTVVKGLQIGNTIGYPTANIEVANPFKLIPPEGIYAVEVDYDRRYEGMLYIGNRPTIDNNLKQTIEVNIFDFNQDIYGEELKIDFIEYLRGDAKFSTLEALKNQLTEDKKAALKVFEARKKIKL
ncbi:bifunctional riboflavin kinase/FAD synthetase [Aureispira sp. CCB-E]|uniref:bifunctional riboflavin kinase/FAD synthetase n=1 Tax=Aureispira sp. CCB-E TaxID=3051121 RepID=UPI00286858F4|nr:bifunctional riboflavin kinase/FAD synthetase [Aureispira sp. CCB-E]WMX11992.1 bifunctional riboflavin kinase/FAD synthetase [Aureispira sp. CCB-E]